MSFMEALQRVGVLKATVRHLWCCATHTFFFSCGEITMALEDVANQVLLPILSNVDPLAIPHFVEEEAVKD